MGAGVSTRQAQDHEALQKPDEWFEQVPEFIDEDSFDWISQKFVCHLFLKFYHLKESFQIIL